MARRIKLAVAYAAISIGFGVGVSLLIHGVTRVVGACQ